ncbi:MAG: Pseudouridine-5'-phosphatase [Geoglossum simile]|nr:MAG: Pseudouridine-5'-phosphatase [Geoglossum simile]
MSVAELPPVRVCIFDVDGLLIDSEDIYTEVYNKILHSYGLESYPWSIKARQQSRGRPGDLRLLAWSKLPLTCEEWKSQFQAHRELFQKSKALRGVPELLSTLSQRTSPPVYIALASSSERDFFGLKTSHLPAITGALPDAYRVFGDDADMAGKRKKPAPDIFGLALQRVNSALKAGEEPIKPEECLVFEDSIAGVEAGRKAGMRVVWVPHPGLLEVCRGHEQLILAGATEPDGQDEAKIEPMTPVPGQGELRDRVRSEDGWAEMLTSLEDFPYDHYRIRLLA